MAWDDTNVFIIGKDLPVDFVFHQIVASEDQTALYNIGNTDSSNNKDIYKFACTNSITHCSWTKIPTQLQYGRSRAVAMTIPYALAEKLCKGIFIPFISITSK